MTDALLVGLLAAGGIYLILQRGLARVTIGFVVLGHAANLLLVISGGTRRRSAPIIGEPGLPADPLPQAFALTAIVIGFSITAFLLSMAYRSSDVLGGDDTEADEEDGAAPTDE